MLRPSSTASRASRRAASSPTRQPNPDSPQPSVPSAVVIRTSKRTDRRGRVGLPDRHQIKLQIVDLHDFFRNGLGKAKRICSCRITRVSTDASNCS